MYTAEEQPQEPSKISHIQESKEAADRVRTCNQYIATKPTDAEEIDKQLKQIKQSHSYHHDEQGQSGTSNSILWKPIFKYVTAKYIQPRVLNSTNKPKLVLIFSHEDECRKIFSSYNNTDTSLAKLMLSTSEEEYPDHTRGSIYIASINSRDGYNTRSDFRHGSFLIQLAIEYSFQQGYEGRITLYSTNSSGKFYFKLGFLPISLTESILKNLKIQTSVDGHEMWLPQEAINAWKEKITLCPIILSEQEINLHIKCHATPRQYNLNKRLNTVLSYKMFRIEDLTNLLDDGAQIDEIENGYKVLHLLILYNLDGKNDALISTLVKTYKADIDIKEPIHGRTPLFNLICEQPYTDLKTVEWLISLGADAHAQDNNGQTLLQAAKNTNNASIIQYLTKLNSTISQNHIDTNMQILSGFIIILGALAVAVAFIALKIPLISVVGAATLSCIGVAAILTNCGFFQTSYNHNHSNYDLFNTAHLPEHGKI